MTDGKIHVTFNQLCETSMRIIEEIKLGLIISNFKWSRHDFLLSLTESLEYLLVQSHTLYKPQLSRGSTTTTPRATRDCHLSVEDCRMQILLWATPSESNAGKGTNIRYKSSILSSWTEFDIFFPFLLFSFLLFFASLFPVFGSQTINFGWWKKKNRNLSPHSKIFKKTSPVRIFVFGFKIGSIFLVLMQFSPILINIHHGLLTALYQNLQVHFLVSANSVKKLS